MKPAEAGGICFCIFCGCLCCQVTFFLPCLAHPCKRRCSKARAAAEVKGAQVEKGPGRAVCFGAGNADRRLKKSSSDFSYKSKYVHKLLREGPASKKVFTKKYAR